jgi:hypothetical protein
LLELGGFNPPPFNTGNYTTDRVLWHEGLKIACQRSEQTHRAAADVMLDPWRETLPPLARKA